MQKLGHTIRNIRKQKGMTLKSLAASTNLSVGFISKIERGINSPSFNNLQKICFALGVTASELVDAPLKEQDGVLLVRKSERTMVYDYSNTVCCESVFSNPRHFALNVMTLKGSNKEYTTSQHTYDEFCIVAKGCMIIMIDSQKYVLEEGDAIMVRANVKHNVQKACDGPCIYHLIKTYDEK